MARRCSESLTHEGQRRMFSSAFIFWMSARRILCTQERAEIARFRPNDRHTSHLHRRAVGTHSSTAAALQGSPWRGSKILLQRTALDVPYGLALARPSRTIGQMERGVPALCLLGQKRALRAIFSGRTAARFGGGHDRLDLLQGTPKPRQALERQPAPKPSASPAGG